MRLRYWIAVGVTTFIVVLLAMIPARVVSDALTTDDLSLSNVRGTLWSGRAHMRFRDHVLGDFRWSVRPTTLLVGTLSIDSTLQGEGLELQIESHLSFLNQDHEISGSITASFLNRLLILYAIQLSGEIVIHQLNLSLTGNREIQQVTGDLDWTGGPVTYELLNIRIQEFLDPLSGTVKLVESDLLMLVTVQDTAEEVLVGRLELPIGWLHIKAKPAFLEYVNAPVKPLRSDSDFLFEISERVY